VLTVGLIEGWQGESGSEVNADGRVVVDEQFMGNSVSQSWMAIHHLLLELSLVSRVCKSWSV
jgi:hypothetical protein